MSELVVNSTGPLSNLGSKSQRTLNSLATNKLVEATRIYAEGDLQEMRIDAIGSVGRFGLQNVALVTHFEQALALTTPLASARLQAIADVASLGIAQVVASTCRRVN